MNKVYENYLETSAVGTEESAWKIEELKVNYSKYFPSDKNARILDIGVGNGEMLHLLKDMGYTNAEGADISQSTINACTARGYKCTLVENTVDFLNLHKNTFAVISMFHVIEHISKEDIIPLVCACREALTDDGCLILETPNMANIDGLLMRYNDFSHLTGYTQTSLYQMLKLCSFEKIEMPEVDIFLKRTLKMNILRFLNKLFIKFIFLQRRIAGIRLETVHGVYLAAIAYKNQEK